MDGENVNLSGLINRLKQNEDPNLIEVIMWPCFHARTNTNYKLQKTACATSTGSTMVLLRVPCSTLEFVTLVIRLLPFLAPRWTRTFRGLRYLPDLGDHTLKIFFEECLALLSCSSASIWGSSNDLCALSGPPPVPLKLVV
jgi:hypothetical protein